MNSLCTCPETEIGVKSKAVIVVCGHRVLAVDCPQHRREALIAAQIIFGRTAEDAAIQVEYNEECAARRRYWIAGVWTKADLAAVEKTIARRLRLPLETVIAAVAEDRNL